MIKKILAIVEVNYNGDECDNCQFIEYDMFDGSADCQLFEKEIKDSNSMKFFRCEECKKETK